jgi:hypothetical protein
VWGIGPFDWTPRSAPHAAAGLFVEVLSDGNRSVSSSKFEMIMQPCFRRIVCMQFCDFTCELAHGVYKNKILTLSNTDSERQIHISLILEYTYSQGE